MSELIRILIADDHPVVRQGLAALLVPRNGMEVVGEASTGVEAVEKANALRPDVVLMDLVMPALDGIAATREIVQKSPAVRILVLTSFSEAERLSDAVRAGALGYLLKDSQPAELLQAIRTVHSGQLALPPAMARKLLELNQQPKERKLVITGREQEVLAALARGLSNQAIADELSIGLNTVRSHVSNLLDKLKLSNRTQLALYARDKT